MRGGLTRNAAREEYPSCSAVIADLIELARRQSRVADDRPGIEPAPRPQQSRKRNAVFADDHHPVARPDAKGRELLSELADISFELAIGPPRAVLDERY